MSDNLKVIATLLVLVVISVVAYQSNQADQQEAAEEARIVIENLNAIPSQPASPVTTQSDAREYMDGLDQVARCFGYESYQAQVANPESYDPSKIGVDC